MGAEILEGSAGWGSGDPCAGLSRQIAAEHELEIVSGKVARDHIRLFVSYGANQDASQIMQWLKGDQLAGVVAGTFLICARNLGTALLGEGLSGGKFWHDHR